MTTRVLWFRRDLRLHDHPALAEAADDASVLGLFVLDPALWRTAGTARRAWLAASLRALSASMDDRLVVRLGDPRTLVASYAAEVGAASVHVTGETTPYGVARDAAVEEALAAADVAWRPAGTPYAVDPGSVLNGSGEPYKVFTPFARAWREHGWEAPLPLPRGVDWVRTESGQRVAAMLDKALREAPEGMPTAGEEAAVRRWRGFRDDALTDYSDARDRPAVDGTSRLSPYLKLGVVHPRQLLADLGGRRGEGASTYVTELAWREFYADVLWHRPRTAWEDLKQVPGLTYDDPADAVQAWKDGRTGFPIVDAGMRQLRHEGWMHNRVRMITASFLTKDLHVWWPVGARHFLDLLVDGDVASNNHGWQWVAGTGTDASPYFRVFNPTTQGTKFDPSGDYVRRWVPELAHLDGKAAHEPWKHDRGYAEGYPRPIVDHAEERAEALRRYNR
jgi:deoxyribodipyrimidine photo-lyase